MRRLFRAALLCLRSIAVGALHIFHFQFLIGIGFGDSLSLFSSHSRQTSMASHLIMTFTYFLEHIPTPQYSFSLAPARRQSSYSRRTGFEITAKICKKKRQQIASDRYKLIKLLPRRNNGKITIFSPLHPPPSSSDAFV